MTGDLNMTAHLYRTRPVVVEAVQLTEENWSEVYRAFVPNANGTIVLVSYVPAGADEPVPSHAEITTLDGVLRANLGDWVIRGVQGELYPCKPDIFEATYDPLDRSSA